MHHLAIPVQPHVVLHAQGEPGAGVMLGHRQINEHIVFDQFLNDHGLAQEQTQRQIDRPIHGHIVGGADGAAHRFQGLADTVGRPTGGVVVGHGRDFRGAGFAAEAGHFSHHLGVSVDGELRPQPGDAVGLQKDPIARFDEFLDTAQGIDDLANVLSGRLPRRHHQQRRFRRELRRPGGEGEQGCGSQRGSGQGADTALQEIPASHGHGSSGLISIGFGLFLNH